MWQTKPFWFASIAQWAIVLRLFSHRHSSNNNNINTCYKCICVESIKFFVACLVCCVSLFRFDAICFYSTVCKCWMPCHAKSHTHATRLNTTNTNTLYPSFCSIIITHICVTLCHKIRCWLHAFCIQIHYFFFVLHEFSHNVLTYVCVCFVVFLVGSIAMVSPLPAIVCQCFFFCLPSIYDYIIHHFSFHTAI